MCSYELNKIIGAVPAVTFEELVNLGAAVLANLIDVQGSTKTLKGISEIDMAWALLEAVRWMAEDENDAKAAEIVGKRLILRRPVGRA